MASEKEDAETIPASGDRRGPRVPPPAGNDDYQVGDEIAHGGMGRILLAHDRRLGRPVAIKELAADDPDAQHRFEREVRITARLQHPAIVPVYEAGAWPDGRPFYAMKMVSGRALDAVIAATTSLDDRLALLPNVIAVAEAMAYAHDQHIIHRDLKPANVLVGAYGETVVIDWGLAKDLTAADDPDSGQRKAAAAQATQAGMALGTPAYMAPEQARGEAADERSDVYGLGALLYHVLTGRPPYDGGSADHVIEKVVLGPPRSLAARAPGVPNELITIVDRAMARDPDARYPTAKEMAADLHRFQTGQLVSAHRYSSWELVRRFVTRHRAAVQVGAVLVAALAVVVTLGLRSIFEERDRAETARKTAEIGRDAAEDLVQFALSDLKSRLRPLGKLDLMERIGDEVDRYYQKLGTPDAATMRRRAEALDTLGMVKLERGDLDGALQRFQAAFKIRGGLGLEQAGSWLNIAQVQKVKGDLDSAERSYLSAQRLYQAELQATPGDRARHNLSVARQNLGDIAYSRGDLDRALAEFRAACQLREEIRSHDQDAMRRLETASCHDQIGDVLLDQGHPDGALAEYQTSLALREQAIHDHPDAVDAQVSMAVSQERIGEIEQRRGNPTAALAAFQRQLALRQKVAENDPSNASSQRDLAGAWQDQGNVLAALGRRQESLDAYRQTLALLQELVKRDPKNAEWMSDLAVAWLQVGDGQTTVDRADAAVEAYRNGQLVAQALVEREPGNREWQRSLAVAYDKLGQGERAQKHLDAAEAAFRKGMALAERLVVGEPTNAEWRHDLAMLHHSLGQVQVERGGLDDAWTSFAKEQEIVEALAAADPAAVQWQVDLAVVCAWEAEVLSRQHKPARAFADRAQDIRGKLLASGKLSAPQRDAVDKMPNPK